MPNDLKIFIKEHRIKKKGLNLDIINSKYLTEGEKIHLLITIRNKNTKRAKQIILTHIYNRMEEMQKDIDEMKNLLKKVIKEESNT